MRKDCKGILWENNNNLKPLSEILSQKIVESIVDELSKMQFESPLFCLKLSYQYVYNYYPSLIPVTLKFKNWVESEEGPFMADPGDFINPSDQNFETEFLEFIQLIEEKRNWMAGTNMLRRAAKMLTLSKLNNKIKVTDGFVAFPVDWEIEGMELDKILIQCGAEKSKVKEWKKLKWI